MAKDHEVILNHPQQWLSLLPKLNANTHKYTRGHTTIIGGYPMTGASRLSALAAARIGSGITTLLVPQVAFPIYAAALTSIIVKPFDNLETFDQLAGDNRTNSFLLGPGAGISDATRHKTLRLLSLNKPTVLDADAITSFEDDAKLLSKHLHTNCIITPHEGEFKRLFNLTHNRILSTQLAAKACGAIVVLKGAETVIALPNGQTIINNNAPPTLATGGTGDVLAGMIAGLAAQGMPALNAAAAATWVHGEAARLFGVGLIAEDLPSLIPEVLQSIQKR